MAKIERKTQKIFAGSGASDDIAVFGSMITGQPVYTDDMDNLQSTAYTQGWGKAIAANEAPFLEEMNGVQYGFSRQIAYLLQNGIPEWDENTTYYATTSFVQVNGVIYQSLTDDNQGNEVTDTTNWRVFFDISNVPTLSGDNEFIGQNNFTTLLEYDGVEVANVDANNFSSIGTTTLSGYGMPSATNTTLTIGTTGETYTAPSNGWFNVLFSTAVANEYISLYNQTSGVRNFAISPTTGTNLGICLPALKDDVVEISYTTTGTTKSIQFITAEGA